MIKRILVINFFPAFTPPKSGGELRYYNVYNNLSQYFDVTLLSPTYKDAKLEIINHSDTFREYRIPKDDIHDSLHMQISNEKICDEISALVCALSAKTMNKYHEYYQKLYNHADIIIHESPYMLKYDMYFGLDNKIRIYNSYNFEFDLVKQLWKGPNADKYLNYIYDLEKKMVKESDLVFAISDDERNKFIKEFKVDLDKVKMAPNGIDVNELKNLRKNKENHERKQAFFIGSKHPPNVEAVKFILNDLSPNCPNIDFYIAGKCCDDFHNTACNVKLLGLISEDEKKELFSQADIAINPMFSGAGTNLKTLEYLSAGIPTISTRVGVRGLDLQENIHYLEANKENFASILNSLKNNVAFLEEISENGQEFINDNYSWESISNNVKENILAISKKISPRKRILMLNDFKIDNPIAGGEVRAFNIGKFLAENNDIMFLCLNNDNIVEVKEISKNFIQIALPKTKEHIEEEIKMNSLYWISSNDIVTSYMISKNEYVKNVVKNLYAVTDITILIHPYMVKLIENLEGKETIYESYNFEYRLKEKLLEGHPKYKYLLNCVEQTEKLSLEKANLVISVSKNEIDSLRNFSGRDDLEIEVVENGVEIVEKKYDYNKLKLIFNNKHLVTFVGSGHAPNVEAAKYIIEELSAKHSDKIFIIIGSVCDAFRNMNVSKNVMLFGRLDKEYKDFLLFSSDIALNPIMSGAGSNLKLAEYFAFGIPTITTEFGCRGYNIENEKHAIICNTNDIDSKINMLINDNNLREKMVINALNYVRDKLDWRILADKYSNYIEKHPNVDWNIDKRDDDGKKLLVLTYRYNNPTRGGAEVYLNNIIKYIALRKNYLVDIISLNVGDIANDYRFACSYTIDNSCEIIDNIEGIRCKKFSPDKIDKKIKWEYSRDIYSQFTKESRIIASSNLELYDEPILLGGWHYPEKAKNGYEVWTSGLADIFTKNVDKIVIRGFSKGKNQINILESERIIKVIKTNGNFEICIENLNADMITIESKVFYVESKDPRPLSLRITSIEYFKDNNSYYLNVENDYRAILKSKEMDKYIGMLVDTANNRDILFDKKFQYIRGPQSKQLENWLDRNIQNYDVVLGHSIPFYTTIMAIEYAKKYNKPVTLLPHFHIDDEFYHWKTYYDALREADLVFNAPKVSKELFYDKIEAKTKYVHGGGILKEEYDKFSTELFEQLYDGTPFILVLGRKSGAKNYKWVIDAVEQLNEQGTKINLIMIGKDEDKEKIFSKYTTYLGEQPREVVLSALSKCEFVVNMSESESFGIVILEAWMFSKAVIVNRDCAAFAELVDDTENGLLSNYKELPQSINYLLENKDVRNSMGENGHRKVKSEFTWEKISEQIELSLGEILR
ncbi:glycosyltransferase family 4 protein [Clostridium chromiireducens]|nr:glycosyltransferase family 4 protein [Clostridium chromiireducens]